ncbi:MAG TPA: hypothetical protein DEF07_06405 [Nitrosomonas sp.]|nr:hypothetical protein [Nitrosomonas sp.]
MQRTLLKIIPVLFSVLLFSSAVSGDTAQQTRGNNPHLLQAIHTLEQKAARETQNIQTLNERIKRLELKVAALNSILLGRQSPKQDSTQSQAPGKPQSTPAKPVHATDSPATNISPGGNELASESFSITNFQDGITNHLVPVLGGLMAILVLLIVLRFSQRKRHMQSTSNDETIRATTAPDLHNPVQTNEKNALVAQKLAALRTAVKKGKQRRHQKE